MKTDTENMVTRVKGQSPGKMPLSASANHGGPSPALPVCPKGLCPREEGTACNHSFIHSFIHTEHIPEVTLRPSLMELTAHVSSPAGQERNQPRCLTNDSPVVIPVLGCRVAAWWAPHLLLPSAWNPGIRCPLGTLLPGSQAPVTLSAWPTSVSHLSTPDPRVSPFSCLYALVHNCLVRRILPSLLPALGTAKTPPGCSETQVPSPSTHPIPGSENGRIRL